MLRLLLRVMTPINTLILKLCNLLGIIAIAAMVIGILIQVFFRYHPSFDALPWPEEFARFCMLWMTGLMAPIAYRQGGFVAIDMLAEMLGKRASAALSLLLLLIGLLVLVMGIKLGYKHVNSGWLFSSSTLKLPLGLIGMETVKLKLVYMYASLWVGLILLTSVSMELILKALFTLISGDDITPTPSSAATASDAVHAGAN